MSDIENIIDVYYKRLSEDNPQVVLATFYSHAFEKTFDNKNIPLFGRLIKMFGREIVFYAITDIYGMSEVNHDNIFPLLKYFCMKRFQDSKSPTEYRDLTKYLEDADKLSERYKKKSLKVRSPFDE